jgi:hypothetical protein
MVEYFSHVLGVLSVKSSITTRPAGKVPIWRSRKILEWAIVVAIGTIWSDSTRNWYTVVRQVKLKFSIVTIRSPTCEVVLRGTLTDSEFSATQIHVSTCSDLYSSAKQPNRQDEPAWSPLLVSGLLANNSLTSVRFVYFVIIGIILRTPYLIPRLFV